MPLDIKDMEKLYLDLFSTGSYLEAPIEAISFIERIREHGYDPKEIKRVMSRDVEMTEKTANRSDGWTDIRAVKSLPIKKTILNALFCPLEEVPLHINEDLMEIAKWRLENAK